MLSDYYDYIAGTNRLRTATVSNEEDAATKPDRFAHG